MPYRILSLDGGGSWALLEAMALKKLYGPDTSGADILKKFNLAAANSGGSIVLAGLALGFSPQRIIDLLNDESKRSQIFVRNFLAFSGVERYDTQAKLAGLRKTLGPAADQLLNTISPSCKLLFCAFDYDRQRAQFFRSDATSPATGSGKSPQPTLAEAVHASTNAPIKYFDAPAIFNTPNFGGRRYWDGAMSGFNNPVLAGVTEALAYGIKPSDIQIISLGTANAFLPLPDPLPKPGAGGQDQLCVSIDNSSLIHDLGHAATVILDDPPDQASYVAQLILNGAEGLSQDPAKPFTNGNLVRFNPAIQPLLKSGGWDVPPLLASAPPSSNIATKFSSDRDVFLALVNLDMDAVEQDDIDLITTLGNAWLADAVPNQPIRANGKLEPLIGHATFSAALAQAKTLGLV